MSIYEQEQQRVGCVKKTIEQQIAQLEDLTSKRRDEVVKIRRHFWDEVKVNTDTFDDYLETIIGLRQEAQALSVSQSTHRQASEKLDTLRRMQKSPYFGKIDFKEDGFPAEEKIYIGIASLMDESGEDFLVYDWRAPISSVYYDYQPGPARYDTPGGTIHGELMKKWQYLIQNGVLVSMFDTSLTIGDEILQQVLGQGTDKHMHSIVSTIQQEQNRVIRHDQGKLLIVHGAAGSGKTSAALQRIAFLLYKNRDSMNADQILLFSPNSMFNSYVSNVLPELGEQNMQQATFQDYLNHRLSNAFQIESPYDQLEYVLTASADPAYKSRVVGIIFKASNPFFQAIESYRESLENTGLVFTGIYFKGEPIVTAEEMAAKFYGEDASLRFHNRLDLLKEWLLKKLSEAQRSEWPKLWVEEEIELLSDEAYYKAQLHLAKKHGYTGATSADYEVTSKELARLVVQQRFKPLRKKIQAYGFIDSKEIYKRLFEDPSFMLQLAGSDLPAEWPEICRATLRTIERGELLYEDATPYLLLHELIQGFQSNRTIKHIVVDEAQDYSPFQFEYLKRLFPSAKMTVLGDFNQAIFAHASERSDFDLLKGLFGPDQTAVANLARSYRSTKPIVEFTRSLMPNGKEIIPFERDGELPRLTEAKDMEELHRIIADKVADLQRLNHSSIAIICKSAEESERAYKALSTIQGLKLLNKGSMEYEQGVVVIPSYFAKGIEFEAVIIYDASDRQYGDERLRKLFYTACTRAMHELHLFSAGEPTRLLNDVPPTTYIRKS